MVERRLRQAGGGVMATVRVVAEFARIPSVCVRTTGRIFANPATKKRAAVAEFVKIPMGWQDALPQRGYGR